MKAIAAVAGETPVGQTIKRADIEKLREAGIVRTPQDLGIDPATATTDRLAAKSLEDLVRISKDIYQIPAGCTG